MAYNEIYYFIHGKYYHTKEEWLKEVEIIKLEIHREEMLNEIC